MSHPKIRSAAWTLALLAALAATAPPAAAGNKADTLFRQGKKAMAEKRYAAACEAFADSQRAEPAIGTQLNLGLCFEEWGKLGSAIRAYRDAQRAAEQAKDDRAAAIAERVAALDPKVPHLVLELSTHGEPPDGLKVTLDGAELSEALGEPEPVDPGPHVVSYRVGAAPARELSFVAVRGEEVKRTLALDAKVAAPIKPATVAPTTPEPTTPEPAPAADPPPPRHLVAAGLGGAGAVTVLLGGYLALDARGRYKDALGAHCAGASTACDPVGLARTHDARHLANVASVATGLGLAALGVGAILYFTGGGHAPEEGQALYLAPTVGDGGAGLVVGGRM